MSVVENSLADIFYAPCPTSPLSPCGSASSFPVPVSQPLPTASAALLLASSRASPPLLQLLFALLIGCNSICTSLGFLHFCSVPPQIPVCHLWTKTSKQIPLASAVTLHQPLQLPLFFHIKFKHQALKRPCDSVLAWDTALVCSTCVPPMEQNAFWVQVLKCQPVSLVVL